MILNQEKLKKKWELAWFWRFVRVMAKMGQSLPTSFFLEVCKFQNFTNSKKWYLKGVLLDFTQKG